MGCIYKRGNIWWIKYYYNGKPYVESSRSDRKAVAVKLLKLREGSLSKGEIPGIHIDKIRFDELAEDFLTDYRINNKKTLEDAERYVKNLKEVFGGMRVIEITTAKVKDYIDRRMEEGLSNASINRELSALKRIFRLGALCTPPKVAQIPYIPMLKEENVRKGFFEHEEFLRLKSALPQYLRPLVTFAYYTGWRLGEITNLTWNKVDLKQGTIRLDFGETKNKEARTIYMNEELFKEMKALHSQRRLGCPYVFHRNGNKIKRFTRTWNRACIKAGLWRPLKDSDGKSVVVKRKDGSEELVKVPTKIFHDFRRTAVRNMIRAGIPERVAMMISGHKTRCVFDRYNIVSDQDLREAAMKQQSFINSQNSDEMVTILVTVDQKLAKN